MTILDKVLRKIYGATLGRHVALDRFFRYREPHRYWKERGGETYFEEQEAVADRTERSDFIGGEVALLDFSSILEIGCGYGKQLRNISGRKRSVSFGGCDFSRPQLLKGFQYFSAMQNRVVEADAEHLPFRDKSFDLVMSSAVILHNEYRKAQRMIWEMIRVARKFLVHNEDTDVTFSRYGYDMTQTYQAMDFRVVESVEIPCAQSPADTQFTVAEIPSSAGRLRPQDIPLQYHKKSAKACR
ncbi:MAG: class I SAM-dependent methyltransferase [Candidatus Omnitrophota bacterium]|jgi:SAM-dependent methyltransferase